MTEYKDVMNTVMSRMQSVPEPAPTTEQSLPQDKSDETLLNTIGLAVNREGGMNI